MMMLSAVVLLVGFLALTGMVARVNQLSTQTGTETRQPVLDEAGPLKRSIDSGLARLSNRTATNCCYWAAGTTIQSTSDLFSAADIGLRVSGVDIPANARITGVASARAATLSTALTVANPVGSPNTVNLWSPGFALKTTTAPTAQAAVISMLEQLQLVEAKHGFWMDWRLDCVGADPNRGQAIASLSDATVWVEVRSTVTFPRADCTVLTG